MKKWALRIQSCIAALDPRLRVLVCTGTGLVAWFCPWSWLLPFLILAFILAWTAYVLTPQGRSPLLAYTGFALFWGLSYTALQLWEYNAAPDMWEAALWGGILFSARLFTLLGLALMVPLTTTALTLGRVLAWYLRGPAQVETALCSLPPLRGRIAPRLVQRTWQAGLALAIMISFLPRAFRALSGLRQSIRIRAPQLSRQRKLILLGLAALRLLGTQTWDMTLAIASRDLYQPMPWSWR